MADSDAKKYEADMKKRQKAGLAARLSGDDFAIGMVDGALNAVGEDDPEFEPTVVAPELDEVESETDE